MAPLRTLFRDTCAGQIMYYLSGHRFLRHPEDEPDFKVPEKFLQDKDQQRGSDKVKRDQRSTSNRSQHPSTAHSDSEETIIEDRGSSRNRVDGSEEEGEDRNLVDWYSEDDAENPLNWSVPRKTFVTFCICLITTSVYSGSSIFTPGVQEAMQTWRVGQVPATLGLSLFVIGYALGPMFLSPMTEIPAIGRTFPYIIALTIFVLLQVPSALTNSFSGFLVLRFLAGFFGSPPLATGGASISDMFAPDTRTFAMGVYGLSAAGGPALGPVISGFAIAARGWHWSMWILLWLSGFALVFLTFTLTETSATNILVRRARRLRKLIGKKELKSQGEIEQANMKPMDIVQMTIIRPWKMTLTEPIVIALNAYIAFVYAVLYCWFESFPIVFLEGYGWGLGVAQLPFLSLLVGSILGFAGIAFWNQNYYRPLYSKLNGKVPPEERLVSHPPFGPGCESKCLVKSEHANDVVRYSVSLQYPAFIGSFCYPICLFWFGWSANRTSWVAPVIAAAFFGIGTTCMFMSALNYLSDAYPRHVASALASNDIVRSLLGAAAPLFAGIMFRNIGIDWGCSLLGFVSLLMIPIPFVLYKFGPQLRNRSKMAD
ncbi:BZ3500_MvSof-1268-A1-R1_Chr7-3g09611 [Microbotryum saponariae]|uniref:BZ3500_MvSof-1268-A1-R1_Chr7-3g09611 protein n=1 Tax=Microbotryum saponariae TaxID=289078 RepID=A0A2X0LB48_9BASI|nr:BZ3500_MvSof-1268-A1-R1_Chr7-3g09611 [Microbotryum saponariae]